MNPRTERVMSWIVVLSAVVMAGAVVRRELIRPGSPNVVRSDGKLRFDNDWQAFKRHGILLGDSTAPISILEFSDLECPACRAFHETLSDIRATYGSRVSVTFLHFPLRNHRFAVPAARAAECADQQGRFAAFVDAIYERQDSLGLKSWAAYGFDAGVSDSLRFDKCVATTAFTRIDSGLAIARRMDLSGTPTVIVNGWRFSTTPGTRVLSRVIDELLAGRNPEKAYKKEVSQ